MDRTPLVAIVGAGFTGTLAAIRLLRDRSLGRARIVLVERPGHGVGGVAYDVVSERLLLNVPAGRMSAFEERPEDFLDFLRARDPAATVATYARRRDFGEYLAARLDAAAREAAAASGGRVRLEPLAGHVRDVKRDAFGRPHLLVDTGSESLELLADAVLLATGNVVMRPPDWFAPWMLAEGRYAAAWSPGAVTGVDGPVLLLGAGLTMADMVVELRGAGHSARIVAVSRRGLLPRVDREPPPPAPGDLPPELEPSGAALRASRLLHVLRAHARALGARGRDWRAVVLAVRAKLPELWSRLDVHERARLLRHARAYWDVHRHRIPGVTADVLQRERDAGRLEVHAGRIVRVDRGPLGLAVEVRPRGAATTRRLDVARIVDCTGPSSGAPLDAPWPHLLERGWARRDPLGLGVLTDADGRLLDVAGHPQPGLYYAGPLWRAQHWEMTAVPELRRGVGATAAAIAAQLARPRNESLPAAV